MSLFDRVTRREILAVLSERQNHRCCYCGKRTHYDDDQYDYPSVEHVLPKVLGGEDGEPNFVMACGGCNNERGCLPLGLFLILTELKKDNIKIKNKHDICFHVQTYYQFNKTKFLFWKSKRQRIDERKAAAKEKLSKLPIDRMRLALYGFQDNILTQRK